MNGNSGGDLDEKSALRHVRRPSQVPFPVTKLFFHSTFLH